MSDPQPTTKKKVVVKKIVKKVVKKKVGDSGTEETIVEEIPKTGAAAEEPHGEVSEHTETISEDGKKKVVKKIVKKVIKKSSTGEASETTDSATPSEVSAEGGSDTPKKKIIVKKVVKKVKLPEGSSEEAKKAASSEKKEEKKEEPKKEEPKKEEPKKEEPKKEEPKKEEPKKEEPKKAEPEKKPAPKEEPKPEVKAPKKEEKKEKETDSKKGGEFAPALNEICYECKQELGNVAVVKALGKRWHINCFVCTDCKEALPGDEFHEHNGVPFCDPCFEKKFMSNCATCKQPINDAALKALGKKYHKNCFVCFGCKKPFPDGEYGVGDDGNPYCDDC